MPNNCDNIVTIKHDSLETMNRLKECLEKDPPAFFSEFIPCPENEEAISYWGTKWDVYDVSIYTENDNTLHLTFYTAWTPPIQAYALLKNQGFSIDAIFIETCCDFCGYWKDGVETIYDNVKDNLERVPEEFHDYFCDDDSDVEDDTDDNNT